jgi:hypothetical protein
MNERVSLVIRPPKFKKKYDSGVVQMSRKSANWTTSRMGAIHTDLYIYIYINKPTALLKGENYVKNEDKIVYDSESQPHGQKS